MTQHLLFAILTHARDILDTHHKLPQRRTANPLLRNQYSMCQVSRMVYTCSHAGTRICLASCEASFNFSKARCNVRNEEVMEWFERNERCSRCRWSNKPQGTPEMEQKNTFNPDVHTHKDHKALKRRLKQKSEGYAWKRR